MNILLKLVSLLLLVWGVPALAEIDYNLPSDSTEFFSGTGAIADDLLDVFLSIILPTVLIVGLVGTTIGIFRRGEDTILNVVAKGVSITIVMLGLIYFGIYVYDNSGSIFG